MVIRTDLESGAIAPQLSHAVWELDPALPISGIETMQHRLGDVLRLRRFRTLLVGMFSLSALILSLAGIYALGFLACFAFVRRRWRVLRRSRAAAARCARR